MTTNDSNSSLSKACPSGMVRTVGLTVRALINGSAKARSPSALNLRTPIFIVGLLQILRGAFFLNAHYFAKGQADLPFQPVYAGRQDPGFEALAERRKLAGRKHDENRLTALMGRHIAR